MAAVAKTKRGGGDFMSSHRVSVVLPRALRLTDRRVQEAKELYAPSCLEQQQHGGEEGLPRRQSADDAKVEDADDDGLLVRRAERRAGKKALVLKAKLESGCSCLVGQAVRIRVKVKNGTPKTVSLVKVYLAERETEGGNVVKRKGVVEEYMQGGVFPMVGESAYTGHLTYLAPPNTRPSNQWRTHDLWVGLKIKASLPGKLWVSFPLQVVTEGQLLGDDDTGAPSARIGGRASVVGVMSDPALSSFSSFSSTSLDSPP